MKHLFIDMDGTIVQLAGFDGKVNVLNYDEPNFFNHWEPIRYMIEALWYVFDKEEFVWHILSASPNDKGIIEKNVWLDKHFHFCGNNRHFIIWKQEDKGEFIAKYCADNDIDPSDCYLVDDDINNLISAELIGANAYHTSRVLSEYERMVE